MPTFFSQSESIARKQHVCNECHCAISAGSKYERTAGKWDGRFEQYKTCTKCVELRNYMKAHIPCFCWSLGGLLGDAIDEARQWRRDAPGLLFHVYRHVVAAKRARDGGVP
jgi:hypothetical protein